MRIFEWIFRNADETGPEIIPADFSNEELAAELDSVRQEVDKLTAEHAAELAAKDEKIAELAADCADKEIALAERDAAISELKAEVKAERESAEEKANLKLAQAGHEPVLVVPADDKSREDKIREEYKALPAGPKRAEFRKANKEFFPGE